MWRLNVVKHGIPIIQSETKGIPHKNVFYRIEKYTNTSNEIVVGANNACWTVEHISWADFGNSIEIFYEYSIANKLNARLISGSHHYTFETCIIEIWKRFCVKHYFYIHRSDKLPISTPIPCIVIAKPVV